MFEKIDMSTVVLVFLVAALLYFASCANETEETPGSKTQGIDENHVYIFDEEEFAAFDKDPWLTNQESETTAETEAETMDAKDLSVGKTYYFVAHTIVQTEDSSHVTLDQIEMELFTSDVFGSQIPAESMLHITDAYAEFKGGTTIRQHMTSEDGSFVTKETSDIYISGEQAKYSITLATPTTSQVEFYAVIQFEVIQEGILSARYSCPRTNEKGEMVGTNTASLDLPEIHAYHAEKINVIFSDISYLASDDYVDGEYNENDLVDSMDMEVGRECYMVMSATIHAPKAGTDSNTVSLCLQLSPEELITGTLDYASSGNFSEVSDENGKLIRVIYTMPDTTKDVQLIVKLTPISAGNAKVQISFMADQASIVGTGQHQDKLLTIIDSN